MSHDPRARNERWDAPFFARLCNPACVHIGVTNRIGVAGVHTRVAAYVLTLAQPVPHARRVQRPHAIAAHVARRHVQRPHARATASTRHCSPRRAFAAAYVALPRDLRRTPSRPAPRARRNLCRTPVADSAPTQSTRCKVVHEVFCQAKPSQAKEDSCTASASILAARNCAWRCSTRSIASSICSRQKNDHSKDAAQNCAPLAQFVRNKIDEGIEIAGVGIGSPGPLNMKAGLVLNPPNLVGWDNFPIVEYFERECGLVTVLNNDANVAGLGEAVLGGGKGYESVIFVGLSTGFGGAYVFRGELINGAHGNAAEYWNMIVNDNPVHHRNANPGSLNEQAGGGGLAKQATYRFGREVSTKELFDLYYAGDKLAIEVVDACADALARGFANIMHTFDPDVVVLGGSVALYHPAYVELAREKANAYLINPDSLEIKPAKFGDDAGLIGAALLMA